MNEQQFREKVLANPDLTDPELIAMARENPAFEAILADARQLNARIESALGEVSVPDSLVTRLKAIPDGLQDSPSGSAANDSFFQYFALAACLVLAVGVSVAANLRPAPSGASMEFGDVVLQHVYMETNEMAAIAAGTISIAIPQPSANLVLANADSNLIESQALVRYPVLFAQPCPIQPESFDSAHLMVKGSKGAINVIVTNNSPVETEFSISDERFHGLVIPNGEGNIVVIGEKDENLSEVRGMLTASVGWSI